MEPFDGFEGRRVDAHILHLRDKVEDITAVFAFREAVKDVLTNADPELRRVGSFVNRTYNIHRENIGREISFTWGADVREWLPTFRPIKILFASPPCTHVAVSGARWFQDKGLRGLIDSLELFDATVRLAEWTKAPYMIENPVSTVSSYWRRPDYAFNPCDYGGYLTPAGDAYTKKTCLWIGNGFVMPRRRGVAPLEGSRMHRLPPSPNRPSLRSETPRGFSQAVYEANHRVRKRHRWSQRTND
jgi:hypothetical protein